jgi:hypothetical protein
MTEATVTGPEPFALTPATQSDMHALMRWFADAVSARTWGGPTFRFPFDFESIVADAPLRNVTCYMRCRKQYNSARNSIDGSGNSE